METEITLNDLFKSLNNMKGNKSPGPDGYTPEFYKYFWGELHPYLFRSLQYAKTISKKLSVTQRQGVLTCLPKGDKPREFLKNWRPISLLNVDYKILSSAIANKIKPALSQLISEDQKGYVKGRYIGECTRLVNDLLDETERRMIPGLLLLVDFEKAFDSIERGFIEKVLTFLGFGKNIIEWIKILYTDNSSCILNNGHCTEYFDITRGVRQGDPPSGYIFIICLEILNAAINYHTSITGIMIDNSEYLTSQYADDSTIALDGSPDSLENCLNVFNQFGQCSGLRINEDKTEAIWIGSKLHSNEILLPEKKLKWNQTGTFTVLGIKFDLTKTDKTANNFNTYREKITNLLHHWTFRKLTILGKIAVLKSLALPMVVHLLMVLPETDAFVKEIQEIFFRFVWDRGRDKVKRNLMYMSYEKGGLKVPNVKLFANSLKYIWIKKILDNENKSKWKLLIQQRLESFGGNLLWCYDSIELINISNKLNPFWKTVVKAWAALKINSDQPQTKVDVLQKTIWHNSNIKIGNRTVFYKTWHLAGISFINDLVDDDGKFYTHDRFVAKYNIRCNFLQHYAVIHSIPNTWKNIINETNEEMRNEEPKYITILKGLRKPTKYFYNELLETINQVQSKYKQDWENSLENDLDWVYHHQLPFKATIETKLQSFQFNIIHRCLVTNSKLWYFKLRDNNRCSFCNLCKERLNICFGNARCLEGYGYNLRTGSLML